VAGGRRVVEPDNHVWIIRRRWLRWRPRWWGPRPRAQDLDRFDLPLDLDFDAGWIFLVVLIILALVAFVFLVLPALLLALQVLIFLLLLAATFVGADPVPAAAAGVVREVAEAIELGQRDIRPDEADEIPELEPH
jgi:hypothetical protein